jgi:hypothetical protein
MGTIRRRKISVNILVPFVIIALVFGVLIWKKMHDSRDIKPLQHSNEAASGRKGVLFFVADGTRLEREARELDSCTETSACLTDLLEELISGPVGDLETAFPESAALNSVRLEGGLVIVDMNKAFVSEMPSGSSAEMLAVYSIVNTVCANYPQFNTVRITVDGNEKTILGHLDLSDPLSPDYSLEQAPAGGAPALQNAPRTLPAQKGHP